MTLAVGDTAPDFALRDQHGQVVTLSAFAGRQSVLVVFYPFAFSGVCTGELQALRDDWSRMAVADVQLLAISCDPIYSLRAFADADALGFPLLSDFWPHGAVSRSYGVFDDQRGCAKRSSFAIDKSGNIGWEVHNALPDARRLADYRRAIAQF